MGTKEGRCEEGKEGRKERVKLLPVALRDIKKHARNYLKTDLLYNGRGKSIKIGTNTSTKSIPRNCGL